MKLEYFTKGKKYIILKVRFWLAKRETLKNQEYLFQVIANVTAWLRFFKHYR